DLEIRGPNLEAREVDSSGTRFFSGDPPTGGSARDFGSGLPGGTVNTGNSYTLDIVFINNSGADIEVPTSAPGTYTKSGANPDKFLVQAQPAFPLADGVSTTLTVLFNTNAGSSSGPGVYTAT